ncbi:MAG: lplA [Pedosphaera sp.]|nr:lplA [Pedosphaera sp.]
MKYIDLTLSTPAENLACDEALLEFCEEGREGEILRFWEPREPFVVVGYANQAGLEANLDACNSLHVPVLRRCSGGGTVLQGSGCLNYSLILRIQEDSPLHTITRTNTFVMERQKDALSTLVDIPITIQGHTDLALKNLKFSGNAQRRKRKCLIFHGTFLLQFDFSLVERVLRMPSKQPDYRQNRPHTDFLTNLNVEANSVKEALRKAWSANELLNHWPKQETADLSRVKYSTREWNLKF